MVINDEMIRAAATRAIDQTGIGGALVSVRRLPDRASEWWIDFTEAERVTVRYDAGDTIETLAEKIVRELKQQRP